MSLDVRSIICRIALCWCFTALASYSLQAAAKDEFYAPFEVTGTVVKNHDGDTITLKTDGQGTLKIRFSGADAPETGQAYWKVSRDYLRALVEGTTTEVACYKKDRYGRDVCHVFAGGVDVGLDLIRKGYAWFADAYVNELSADQQVSYRFAEKEARGQKAGLWIDPNPMPPGECRKLRRAGKKCR